MKDDCIGLIPAAGKGVRLGLPYPKELHPVISNNTYKPVAQCVLENLTAAGLEHIVFVVTEAKHQLLGHFGDGKRFGCSLSYVIQEGSDSAGESQSPGLAHALDSAYHLTKGKTVYFGMADTVMRPDDVFRNLTDARRPEDDVVLGLFETERPEKFGMVEFDDAGTVSRIDDKPQHTTLKSMWGCMLWSPAFTEHLRSSIECGVTDFAEILNSAIAQGMRMRGVSVPNGVYADLGTWDEIEDMNRRFSQGAPVASQPQQAVAAPEIAPPDMSVVLVCWNNLDYLRPCLQSLYDADLESTFEVVVVDNGSTDGTQEFLRSNYPELQVIQNDRNVGLGRASNQGIDATSGRHILLLNNDTVVNRSSLDGLVKFLDANPTVGGVGGRLLNADGSFQAGFADFSTLLEELLIATRIGEALWQGYPSHEDSTEPKKVAWLSSACLLLRRSALDDVGLLDEEYFIYGDEADLQYRLRQADWPVYFLPEVETLHYGGRSMTRWRRRKMVSRGKMLFYSKNYGPLQTGVLRAMLGVLSLGKLGLWSAAYLIPSRRERAALELDSNWDVFKLCWRLA